MKPEPKTGASAAHRPAPNAGPSIQVFGLELSNPRAVKLPDKTPVGSQIAFATGFNPDQQASVVQWRVKELEDIGPNEAADLSQGMRFIVVESDGTFRLTIDGLRFDWPASTISVVALRKLAEVPAEKAIFLERQEKADKPLADDEVISLKKDGVECFSTRRLKWELQVQGVTLTLHEPTIMVRDALSKAGLNPDQGWQIFLLVKGQTKKQVGMDFVIDLRTHGIEKLRVSPVDVGNGEAAPSVAQGFRLLEGDEAFLNANYPGWEAIVERGRRWLLLQDYALPSGYTVDAVCLALEIPPTYPAAQIDMFYLLPAAVLRSGGQIPATEYREDIRGQQFQRWSRHRGAGNQWSSSHDNVVTHLALVESAILKEVHQ